MIGGVGWVDNGSAQDGCGGTLIVLIKSGFLFDSRVYSSHFNEREITHRCRRTLLNT